MSTQQEEKTVEDADPDPAVGKGNASYSPQDVRSGLSKKPLTQPKIVDHPGSGNTELDMSKPKQKSPTKKTKGKATRGSPVKKATSEEETIKVPGKLNADDPATTKEDQSGEESVQTVTELMQPASADAVTLAPTTDASLAADRPEDATHNLALQLLQDSKASDMVRENEKSPIKPGSKVSPALPSVQARVPETTSDAVPVDEGHKNTSTNTSNTASKEPSSPVADDSVSDDEAKNDTSFHSAPEIQPESAQAELLPRVQDKAMPTKQGTVTLNSFLFYNSLHV
jgi:hypothetical protein